jgi:hypothetical protein
MAPHFALDILRQAVPVTPVVSIQNPAVIGLAFSKLPRARRDGL